ncbi:dTMP kinase [Glycomyces tarimensis]
MSLLTRALPLTPLPGGGALLTFCGIDGSGKSTLVREIEALLTAAGHRVTVTRSPTRAALDIPAYKRYMYEPESRDRIDYRGLVCALTGDRLQHAADVINPCLQAGEIVLCDRYVYDAQAHLLARGYSDEPWFLDITRHLPAPTLAILAYADLDTCLGRVAARPRGEESYIERPFVDLLHENYKLTAKLNSLTIVDTSHAPVAESVDLIRTELQTRGLP